MPNAIYKITPKTNLHAGSGDTEFGIVDKLVQKDATTGLPTIYASSLKGALREYFKVKINSAHINEIFGSEENAATGTVATVGSFQLLAADILSLPSPKNDSPFYQKTYCPAHIADLNDKYGKLGYTINIPQGNPQNASSLFKEAAENLPVIARNHLENGISKNLWYEQVVPHEAEFIVAVIYPNGFEFENKFNLHVHNKIIQVGANATVGYGICLFEKLN
jgi:CRISPR-associated protein Cmr4